MTTAGDNPLYGQFDAMLDSIINPRGSGRSSGVICCADLYCGDGEANHAAYIAGTKVTYAYTTSDDEAEKYLDDFFIEPFTGSTGDSVRMAPEFDLLLVRIGEDALTPPPQPKRRVQRYDAPVEHALRFMRVRKPAGVLFWGRDLSSGIIGEVVEAIADDADRLSYLVQECVGDDTAFVAAIQHLSEPFPWPSTLLLEDVIASVKPIILSATR